MIIILLFYIVDVIGEKLKIDGVKYVGLLGIVFIMLECFYFLYFIDKFDLNVFILMIDE